MRWSLGAMGALLLLTTGPSPAAAHGFGQRYDLPVPLWLWLSAAAAAVILSFVVGGVFITGTAAARYPRLNLRRSSLGRALTGRAVRITAQLVSVGVLGLMVVAGLVGNQNPTRNLAPTAVWIVWWVGLAYVSALVGNLWALLNPWNALFRWSEALVKKRDPDGELSLGQPYPRQAGVWPAVALFTGFAWLELVSSDRALPRYLALMILLYSVITWAGMVVFGRHVWLRRGDPFALAFGVLARFSPTEVRVTDPAVCRECSGDCRDRDGDCIDCYECFERAPASRRELNLRPFAVGLLRNTPISPSMGVFIILLLSTVTYDGFTATPLWGELENALYAALPDLGGARLTAVRTLGLLAFPALFLTCYGLFARWATAATGTSRSPGAVGRALVVSLVPIAIAYHLAHYFTFLLIQGQLLIPLLSDPFGYGWNVLGTAGHRIDIAVVGARFAWYTAVTAIVLGHIVAVYVAHVVALREFDRRRVALQSQYPMLVLMVGYTLVSLWIIAQPIVETDARATAAETSTAREPAFRQLLDNDRITIVEITLPPRFEGETHMAPYDEAAYVLEGELTVVTGPGSVEAFGAGAVGWAAKGTIHRSRNPRDAPVKFLVVIPKER